MEGSVLQFLDAIAITLVSQSVSEWVIISDFADSYLASTELASLFSAPFP